MKLIKFNITIMYLMSSVVSASPIIVDINGVTKASELGEIETKLTSLKTGNHHCDSNCEGEPTRTTYSLNYSADRSKHMVVDASLSCGGEGCGWSGNRSVQKTNSAAWATFDVWGRESTWTLNVSVRPVISVPGPVEQVDSDQVQLGKTFVVEHDTNRYLDVEIETILPKLGKIRMNPMNPIKPYFKKIGESTFGETKTYTIQYLGE